MITAPQLARSAYEAYAERLDWADERGGSLLPWDQLSPLTQAAWRRAVVAAVYNFSHANDQEHNHEAT